MSPVKRGSKPAALAVIVPLLNPNEREAQVADLSVEEGQHVEAGAELCTLETTKSTSVVEAETAGYIAGLRAGVGQTVRAGEILCYLAPDPDWRPPELPKTDRPLPARPDPDEANGLRATGPALALARKHNLDLKLLPRDVLVTESVVRAVLSAVRSIEADAVPGSGADPRAVLVYGGGGHGKAVIELLQASGNFDVTGLIDDGLAVGSEVLGVRVLGGAEALAQLFDQGVRQAVNAVGGIGDIASRVQVFERLSTGGFHCPTVVHPSAVLEPSAKLDDGVQVFPLAYVGSSVSIGYGAIVNTGTIVSHDCQVGEYANLSPGAILAGDVEVGARSLIGMGVTVNLGVKIGLRARIGNGATVKSDVPDQAVIKAGSVWPSP